MPQTNLEKNETAAEMKAEDVIRLISSAYPGSCQNLNQIQSSGFGSFSKKISSAGFRVESLGPRLSSFEGAGLDAKEVCVLSSTDPMPGATFESFGISNPAACLLVILDETGHENFGKWMPSFKHDGLSNANIPKNPFGPVVEVSNESELKKMLALMKCGTLIVKVMPKTKTASSMIE
ncbi:hypothetical protein [Methanolapillus ohkumae]|uniref:Uncharacterized protein n=1 Tax=Methanolapillus ohkumae TaxID=3028298 RepID=A0AA96V6L6_9EURY|nr:hypothetical protein MsAm2_05770 [Methanosarcinaceae archaeon Am2]